MRRKKLLASIAALAGLMLACGAFASPVHANLFDRVKDIYQTPERLQQLQNQYDETKMQLEEQLEAQREMLRAQAEQLETSRKQAEELMKRQERIERENESFRRQNEALLAERQELIERIEQAEEARRSAIRLAVMSAGILIGLFALYAFSIRIWRYAVWRRQGRDRGREVLLP